MRQEKDEDQQRQPPRRKQVVNEPSQGRKPGKPAENKGDGSRNSGTDTNSSHKKSDEGHCSSKA